MEFQCVGKCGTPVAQEFGRCSACQTEHEKLAASLDAKPKVAVERQEKDWVFKVEMKGGIPVKVFATREDARVMGWKLPDETNLSNGNCRRCGDKVEAPRILCDVCRAIPESSDKQNHAETQS